MATAALDYFLSRCPIPSTETVPSSGSPLFNYLLDRQLDSLGLPDLDILGLPLSILGGPLIPGSKALNILAHPALAVIRKFISWTNRPDTTHLFDGLRELTVPEFRATIRSLCAAQPVVLGLIYAGPGAVSIWKNHQVLAYDYTFDPMPVNPTVTFTDIKIYDPNYKEVDDAVIRCWELGKRVRCEERVSGYKKLVRGFFRMPYTAEAPPCLP